LLDSTSTLDQPLFTISEVAADWHELMIPRRIMRPSVAYESEQLDRGAGYVLVEVTNSVDIFIRDACGSDLCRRKATYIRLLHGKIGFLFFFSALDP